LKTKSWGETRAGESFSKSFSEYFSEYFSESASEYWFKYYSKSSTAYTQLVLYVFVRSTAASIFG
jgi:predicted metalloprotease